MDEIKTNPPVENTTAEPPKKVRRVGTIAFAVLLIAGGVLLLAQQFMPKANLLAVLKFSPAILIVLGIEVLVYSAKPDVKLKFDWLGVLGCAFILTHPIAATGPKQMEEYKIHDNPPGISGWLIEGRFVYDCFVLNEKADAIWYQGTAIGG